MTITFNDLDHKSDTANATNYTTNSYVPTPNRVICALVEGTGTLAAGATYAGNGLTWTAVEVELATNSHWLFWAPTGTSPSIGIGTFDCTADAATGVNIQVLEIGGCDFLSPFRQITTVAGAGAGSTPSRAFDNPTLANCGIIASVRNNDDPLGVTGPATFTNLTSMSHGLPNTGNMISVHPNPGVLTTVTWGSSSVSIHREYLVEVRNSMKQLAALGVG